MDFEQLCKSLGDLKRGELIIGSFKLSLPGPHLDLRVGFSGNVVNVVFDSPVHVNHVNRILDWVADGEVYSLSIDPTGKATASVGINFRGVFKKIEIEL